MGFAEYLQAAKNVYDPTQSGFSLGDAWDTLMTDGWYGLTGTVSPDHKDDLVKTETAKLIDAGMNPAEAAATAQGDVDQVLKNANADPSQLPDWLTKLMADIKYGFYVVLALAAIYVAFQIVAILK